MKRSLGGGAPDPGESDGGGGSTRSSRGSHWTKTARRSFLKRRKGGSSLARSSSRESKELATFRYDWPFLVNVSSKFHFKNPG